jgi:multidrug efflux system membrane fusion protein
VVEADGKTVQSRPVTVAQVQDGLAVIESGIAAGERVVVDGHYKLKPGAHIVEAAHAASAPASAGSGAGAAVARTGARA